MPALSLAKCLKLKNRLVNRLSIVQYEIQSYNSQLAEQKPEVDVRALDEQRKELTEAIIRHKTALMVANSKIHEMLIRQAELKGEIAFLAGINTRDGLERHSYQNTEIKHVAVIKKSEVADRTRAAQKMIDELQDRIDEYNHSTKIEVSQRTLDLAS